MSTPQGNVLAARAATVYTEAGSKPCESTEAFLSELGVGYLSVEVDKGSRTDRRFRARGIDSRPVVETRGGQQWTGFELRNVTDVRSAWWRRLAWWIDAGVIVLFMGGGVALGALGSEAAAAWKTGAGIVTSVAAIGLSGAFLTAKPAPTWVSRLLVVVALFSSGWSLGQVAA